MNTQLIAGILALIIIGGGWYAFSEKDDAMMEKNDGAMMQKEGGTEADEMMESAEQQAAEAGTMMQKDDGAMMHKDGAMMEKGETMMSKGTYEIYAPEKIAWATADHDVVLFFKASWCPTCRAVDADIKGNLGSLPANLTILEVNYDDSTALKQKYGVTTQHTFVQVDAQGNLIKKWRGSPTLVKLVAEVQ